ncbi:MAG: Rpn family recombination-promoting nuclease/putative transposase [Thermodesulfobacteriota bacterium]|nr:Rpn family recombination-promoting nuclease/putative transposase [Thermodesulfobacteriota bacterium]
MAKRRLISFDWAMKKLLRSKANFEILEGFLSELLKEGIHILEILESESNKIDRSDKFNRVDLKVKNAAGEIIIIEVQYEHEFDYLQRILYGTSKVITEHLKEKDPYADIVKVISVNILYFDLGHGSDYIYHGTTSFKGLHDNDQLQLSDKQQHLYQQQEIHQIFPEYYLIKVNNFNDTAKDTLDEWIYFLKNEEIKEEFKAQGLTKAKRELDILKLPELERAAYERYQDDLHYQASMVESSYTVGTIDGKKEGIEQGRKEESITIAKKLLDVLDVHTISAKTGLSESEIIALKK